MENIPKRKRNNDEFNKLSKFAVSLSILAALTFVFAEVWFWINANLVEIWAFDKRGNILMVVLYFILQYIMSRVYGAFKIGFYKAWDIVYSQALTTVMVDILMYIIASLVARELLPVAPFGVMLLIQFAVIVIWAHLGTFLNDKIYPPRDMVLIYSNHSVTNLVQKMAYRDDQFRVCEAVKAEEGLDYIFSRIKDYDGVIICEIQGSDRNDILKFCYDNNKRVYVIPKISDIMIRGGESVHMFDTPLLLCRNSGLTFEERFFKRLMDIVLSLIGLIIMAIPMLITAVAIKLDDGGPVFFRQDRVTKDDKVFKIIKFRSMKVDADADTGAHSATKDDDRITRVGRVIRAIRMDEWPQLINILKGDMSIVGPRCEMVENVQKYTQEIPEFKYRTKVKAGLTGYAQVYGKYNTTAYDKLKLDLYYIENYSLRTDIQLIFMTIKVLFMRESTEEFETDDKR
ncbi:MAG: sugar transferase [Clostridia bacterium]|nr:sugar transferase [Clostridia bacterium]MBR6480008.1 sugar transferase [Clostridia bacterium]MBR6512421.1 sugar transferase [Clostridia bacterium]